MPGHATTRVRLFGLVGLAAFLFACVSVVDLFLPHPYDGVVLEADTPGQLMVAAVTPGSGADIAGIEAGDRIVGIGREVLRSTRHAAHVLEQHSIGEQIPYLVETRWGRKEKLVELGQRQIASIGYLSAVLLGLTFFLLGMFVLLQKPLDGAAQIFFLLSVLFLLFLVCRLRPLSYSDLDLLTLRVGTLALLLLPGAFLHFFLIFPRPVWEPPRAILARLHYDAPRLRVAIATLYLSPAGVYLVAQAVSAFRQSDLILVSGAPRVNWIVLGVYMVLGLAALAFNAHRATRPNVRRGAGLVFFGALFGLVPFLVFTVAFPSLRYDERLLYYGVGPLILVPLTFTYAIVRFQLLDIRVILRKSLFYTAATALVTAIYAVGIATFNWIFHGTQIAQATYFPVIFALAIVLGLEPIRRRLQGPVDRFFLGDLSKLQSAIVEMGESFSAHVDPGELVTDLVDRLPRRLGLEYAALYLRSDDHLDRAAGPRVLPESFRLTPELEKFTRRAGAVVLLEQEVGDPRITPIVRDRIEDLIDRGVEIAASLASPRRPLGFVLLSKKSSQLAWENAELELLRGLFAQAAMALETSLLLDERTRQAEMERELKIAASIQESLLPSHVTFAPGWEGAARCRPAHHVGGDFFSQLSPGANSSRALVYGDVAGKSVPAALMMMAAQEILYALSLTFFEPERLLQLANQRLYELRRRSFVALGYLAPGDGGRLRYVLAGQPELLCRRANGQVEELPLAEYRLPLGAFAHSNYVTLEVELEPGDLVFGCTDGILEARSSGGEFFGRDRLASALAHGPSDPAGTVADVLDAVMRFTGDEALYDDMTLVAVRRRPEGR